MCQPDVFNDRHEKGTRRRGVALGPLGSADRKRTEDSSSAEAQSSSQPMSIAAGTLSQNAARHQNTCPKLPATLASESSRLGRCNPPPYMQPHARPVLPDMLPNAVISARVTRYDSCAVYGSPTPLILYLDNTVVSAWSSRLQVTDDYILTVALGPNQRQDFGYPFTACRTDSPSGRAKPKRKKSESNAKPKMGISTIPPRPYWHLVWQPAYALFAAQSLKWQGALLRALPAAALLVGEAPSAGKKTLGDAAGVPRPVLKACRTPVLGSAHAQRSQRSTDVDMMPIAVSAGETLDDKRDPPPDKIRTKLALQNKRGRAYGVSD
ncbi:hypothetical protein MKX08_009222 [Trichoderma sp. CBMAI-0020]|nr:hypothetical protein MKX08_009222 [Trichoderma sp. CBMAI-0020]